MSPFQVQDLKIDTKNILELLKSANFEKIYLQIEKIRDVFRMLSRADITVSVEDKNIIRKLSENSKEKVYELLKINSHFVKKMLENISNKLNKLSVDITQSESSDCCNDSAIEIEESSDNQSYVQKEIQTEKLPVTMCHSCWKVNFELNYRVDNIHLGYPFFVF